MTSQYNVYVGVWTDWSSNSIPFNTLTLPVVWGGFLVAFLAMYVRTAGRQLWNIIRFAAHQTSAARNRYEEEAPFLQQQAILRNTSTSMTAGFKLASTSFAWRKSAPTSAKRAHKLMILALLHSLVFALAGLFSSRVTKAGRQDILITGGNCGEWSTLDSTEATTEAWQSKVLTDSISAAAYASNCYKDGDGLLGCTSYVSDSLPWTFNTNETCPFASGMCFGGDTAAYSMDTGPLDSRDDLGINTKESLKFRHKRTCAPVEGKGFAALEYLEIPDAGNFSVDRMYFGTNGVSNWTNEYFTESVRVQIGYGLSPVLASPDQENAWTPVSQLNRTDADVSLFFVNQNSIRYEGPVDDPIFSAHSNLSATADGLTVTWYESDYYTNMIGCIDQTQICNPSVGCTPLSNWYSAFDAFKDLGLTLAQGAVAKRLTSSLIFQTAFYAVSGRGASALRANDVVSNLDSPSLPDNQWQIEVDGWFGLSLARLQRSVVDYAASPTDLPQGIVVLKPLPGADQDLCSAQKIKGSTAYQNFNFVGVMLVIGFCTLIILLGLTLEYCVAACQNSRSYPKLAWRLDNFTQLHRMAQENAGYGRWERSQKAIPTIHQNEPITLGRYIIEGHEHATIDGRVSAVLPKSDPREYEAMLQYGQVADHTARGTYGA